MQAGSGVCAGEGNKVGRQVGEREGRKGGRKVGREREAGGRKGR